MYAMIAMVCLCLYAPTDGMDYTQRVNPTPPGWFPVPPGLEDNKPTPPGQHSMPAMALSVQQATETLPVNLDALNGRLLVQVPENATVYIDGKQMEATGAERMYVTQPISDTVSYDVDVKPANGGIMRRVKAKLRPGRVTTVDARDCGCGNAEACQAGNCSTACSNGSCSVSAAAGGASSGSCASGTCSSGSCGGVSTRRGIFRR
jgi:hypothetical protein